MVIVDRLVATRIHMRHDLPHAVLGLLFRVDRSTITRAIAEIRTLLAERGCAVPERPGLRLRDLAGCGSADLMLSGSDPSLLAIGASSTCPAAIHHMVDVRDRNLKP
ncbi:transposase family protein [Streptomyces xantholiticus]